MVLRRNIHGRFGRRRRGARAPFRWLRRLRFWALIAVALYVAVPMLLDGAMAALRPGADGCRIAQVIDGDTVQLVCPGAGWRRARLVGYDAPEVFSPRCRAEFLAAERAKWALRGAVWQANSVVMEAQGADRYGRLLVRVRLDGADVADAMIGGGHGRAYDGGRRQSWCEAGK